MTNKKYTTHAVKRGDWLDDEIYGRVEVGGISDAQIPWPYRKKNGRRALILCGDLAQAVRDEAAIDIMRWFGVGFVTVAKWRKALGVDRQNNAGTQALYKQLKPIKLPPDAAQRGRIAARTPEALEKMRQSKKGLPSYRRTDAHKRAISERMTQKWAKKREKNEQR